MAEKNILVKETLEHAGIFNFSEFYEYAYRWFKEEGYGVVEDKYAEKVSGATRDITVEWKASHGISDYFSMEIAMKLEVTGASDVEVEIEGTKKKMNKGRFRMDIKGTLIRDPSSKWDSSPFNSFLRGLYNKYIVPGQIFTQEERVKGDVKDFKEALKSLLELQGRR